MIVSALLNLIFNNNPFLLGVVVVGHNKSSVKVSSFAKRKVKTLHESESSLQRVYRMK